MEVYLIVFEIHLRGVQFRFSGSGCQPKRLALFMPIKRGVIPSHHCFHEPSCRLSLFFTIFEIVVPVTRLKALQVGF
jgi:hypothetical protein